MKLKFNYVLESSEPEDTGFYAWCPEVPEANAQGETEAEAIADLESCIEFCLECRLLDAAENIPADALRGELVLG